MPELPEVEVTRRRLAPLLEGRQIARLRTTQDSYFFRTKPRSLQRRLKGRTLRALSRRGKYLIAALDDGSSLVLHLGMTGQLFGEGAVSPRLLSATARASLDPEKQVSFEPDAHTHLQFEFSDGGPRVFFRDVRKFGKVAWFAPGVEDPRLAKLGIDALEIKGPELAQALAGRKVAIKSLLLNQSVLAGVGNIYADEALFHAGIDPRRPGANLTPKECETLVKTIQRVLFRSIETGGSSISDYINPDGSDGKFQDERCVYGLTGQPCSSCQTPIERLRQGQRSTHYCPSCQL